MSTTEIARMFASVAHVWEGRGVHAYEQGDPQDCPVCEALDAILANPEEDERRQAATQRFWEEGLVFLCNMAVLHPRGYALTVSVNEDGKVESMFVQGDGDEPWVFGRDDIDDSVTQVLDADLVREKRWQARH